MRRLKILSMNLCRDWFRRFPLESQIADVRPEWHPHAHRYSGVAWYRLIAEVPRRNVNVIEPPQRHLMDSIGHYDNPRLMSNLPVENGINTMSTSSPDSRRIGYSRWCNISYPAPALCSGDTASCCWAGYACIPRGCRLGVFESTDLSLTCGA